MFRKLFVSIEMLCRGLQTGTVTQDDLDHGVFFFPETGPLPTLERLRQLLSPGLARNEICDRIACALRLARREGRLARFVHHDDDPPRLWAELNRFLAINGLPGFPDPEDLSVEEGDEAGMIGFFGRFRGLGSPIRNEAAAPSQAWAPSSWAE